MRFPKPVLINPLAKKNAIAINHGISLENAENAAENGNKPVVMLTPRPIIATAPSGNGCVMIPTIVATNTENKCHACVVTPAGAGKLHKSKPAKPEYPRFFTFAPLPLTKAGFPAEFAAANETMFASLLPLFELVRTVCPRFLFKETARCAASNTSCCGVNLSDDSMAFDFSSSPKDF